MRLEASLTAALEAAENERQLQPFLKKHPLLVRNALNVWAWNYVEVFPEFRCGPDFRADFLIVSADSGSWHAVFVELKSHRDRLFTKAGVPSRALAIGLRQLDDWERWVQRQDAMFREHLSTLLAPRCVPAQCSRGDRHMTATTEVRDPRTVIWFRFKLLMGRRHELTDEDQDRRGSYHVKDRELVTYDRLLDYARRHDEAEKERVRLARRSSRPA